MAREVSQCQLIAAVEKHPELWDTKNVDYSDRIRKACVWQNLTRELTPNWQSVNKEQREKREEIFRIRWKSLRDSFRRHLTKAQTAALSGASAPIKCKSHPYESQLPFLRPSMESRETTSNCYVEHNEGEEEDVEQNAELQSNRTSSTVQESDPSLAYEEVTPQCSVHEESSLQDSSSSSVAPTRRARDRGRGRQQRQPGDIADRLESILRNLQQERPSPLSNPNNHQAAFCITMYHTLSDLNAERSKEAMDSIATFLAACRNAQRSGLPSPIFHTVIPPTPQLHDSLAML